MPTDVFKHNGVTISVREKIGRDELNSPWLLHDLAQAITTKQEIEVDELSNLEWGCMAWFVDVLLRSEITGDLGFEWPDLKTATVEELHAAYESLMDGDAELVRLWRNASKRADLEIADPED